MENEQLFAEIEDLLRQIPVRVSRLELHEPDVQAWFGRAMALINAWDFPQTVKSDMYFHKINNGSAVDRERALQGFMSLLHQARHDLMMKTVGPVNAAVPTGKVFNYFDEIRKIIETATTDVLFVDPYLDAEFISRYLSYIPNSVVIRLLTRERLKALLPAVRLYVQESGATVEVRSVKKFHDRYVFVDGARCFQSGASFKDGGRNAPTTITEITDAFSAVKKTYEDLWASGTVEL